MQINGRRGKGENRKADGRRTRLRAIRRRVLQAGSRTDNSGRRVWYRAAPGGKYAETKAAVPSGREATRRISTNTSSLIEINIFPDLSNRSRLPDSRPDYKIYQLISTSRTGRWMAAFCNFFLTQDMR